MYCLKCGNKLDDGMKFCNKCGAPVELKVEQKTGRKKVILLVASVLVVVILAVAGVVAFMGKNSNTSNSDDYADAKKNQTEEETEKDEATETDEVEVTDVETKDDSDEYTEEQSETAEESAASTQSDEEESASSENTEKTTEESTEEESTEDIEETDPVYYLNVTGYDSDGLIWGSVDIGRGRYYIIDIGDDFSSSQSNEVLKSDMNFVGDYAAVGDSIIIDRDGNVVFDLDDTDFDSICWYSSRDVGFVICDKTVNTFDDTGTYYYRIDLQLDCAWDSEYAGTIPSQVAESWKYFEGGYFWYTDEENDLQMIYNIVYNYSYPAYQHYWSSAEGDVYVYSGTSLTQKYYQNGDRLYGIRSGKRMEYYLSDGFVFPDLGWDGYGDGTFEYRQIKALNEYIDDSDNPWIAIDEDTDKKVGLYDVLSYRVMYMTDYADFEYHGELEDGGYVMMVENEEGSQFVTVIDWDDDGNGTRRFEPINFYAVIDCGSNCFIIQEGERTPDGATGYFTCQIYNSDGELLAEYDGGEGVLGCYNRDIIGDNTILYYDDDDLFLLDIESGEITSIDDCLYEANLEMGNDLFAEEYSISSISRCYGYYNGYYIFETDGGYGIVLSEDGEMQYLTVDIE